MPYFSIGNSHTNQDDDDDDDDAADEKEKHDEKMKIEELMNGMNFCEWKFEEDMTFTLPVSPKLKHAEQSQLVISLWDDDIVVIKPRVSRQRSTVSESLSRSRSELSGSIGVLSENLSPSASRSPSRSPSRSDQSASPVRFRRSVNGTSVYSGCVRLPLWTLLHLRDGVYSLPIIHNTVNNAFEDSINSGGVQTKQSNYVIGYITLRIRLKYPKWDHIQPFIPKVCTRKVQVLSAVDLPLINNQKPSCSCHIVLKHSNCIKKKSSIIKFNHSPIWNDAICEVLIDQTLVAIIIIEIYHTSDTDRKEFCIGEVNIPCEVLLRPPKKPIDLFLQLTMKKSPVDAKFTTSGCVKVQISELTDQQCGDALLPQSRR